METHAFGFRLRANAPEGPKAISYQLGLGLTQQGIQRRSETLGPLAAEFAAQSAVEAQIYRSAGGAHEDLHQLPAR
jgi:hypothetical protein